MSGWTALTIHASDDEQAVIIDEALRQEYTGREPYSAEGYADCTVQVGRGVSHSAVARKFAEEFPDAEHIIVVSANDTSDSGRGTLFSIENGTIEEVDSMDGYEGAMGRDVTGYFQEEYGVTGYSSFEA